MRNEHNAGQLNSPQLTDGDFVIEFFEAFCRATEGEHAGELMQLELFQKQLLLDLFELRPDYRRRYRKALIGMPRKNAKSYLGSGLALYLLIADGEPGAEVYSCAGDKEQAKIVFNSARRMVELEPELSSILKPYRDAIEYKATDSVYRALSAEAFTKEGLNPSGVIFDEVHVQPNRELWTVMTMGSGTRRQPLVVGITTAGYDLDTLCGELYLHGKKVESGEVEDPTFFFRWWEPKDPKCDYRDPKVWTEANPALGKFLYIEDLEDAVKPPTTENEFRRYRLNQWTTTAEAWLPFGAWDACKDESLNLDPALPVHVGIDVGLKHDSSGVVAAQKQSERTVIRGRIWENPFPPDDKRHGDWKLDIAEVEEYLRQLFLRFPVPACEIDGKVKPGPEFCYDPFFFERSAQLLEKSGAGLEGEDAAPFSPGLAMVEFPQTDSRMCPASQQFYQMIIEKVIAHDGDPGLKRHVGNVIADQKPRGTYRMSKPKGSKKKIDSAIAAAIAAHRAQEPAPEVRRSVYERRGIVSAG